MKLAELNSSFHKMYWHQAPRNYWWKMLTMIHSGCHWKKFQMLHPNHPLEPKFWTPSRNWSPTLICPSKKDSIPMSQYPKSWLALLLKMTDILVLHSQLCTYLHTSKWPFGTKWWHFDIFSLYVIQNVSFHTKVGG